jgi:Fic family protein
MLYLIIGMKRVTQGKFLSQGSGASTFRTFVPVRLPPMPPLRLSPQADLLHASAALAVGRLDGISRILPDTDLLLYFYTRREAVLSSQIEGTQSSLSDLLLFEENVHAEGPPDVREVSNYVAAMRHGLRRMQEGFPLSLRLLREMHAVLMQSGRGSEATAGEFRRSQNWVGGSRPGAASYVPPSVPEMQNCLDALEKFLHGDAHGFAPLVQAALLHVQFESIHPFLDGNGRLGRLLIALLLVERGVLSQPLLYLSLYLKENRGEYYSHLQSVRMSGRWEEWIEFFLQGVVATAEGATLLAENLLALFERDRQRLLGGQRQRGTQLQIFQALQRHPYLTIQRGVMLTGLSTPTVTQALRDLESTGMVREITGMARRRIFAYGEYLDLLAAGTGVIKR